jgi:hypothetical protein
MRSLVSPPQLPLGISCVRKTFEQRQFRQAVRIGASTNLLLPTLRRIGQVLDLVFRFGFRTSLREHRRGAAADRRTRPGGADNGPQVRPAPPDVAPADEARAMRFSRVRKHEN